MRMKQVNLWAFSTAAAVCLGPMLASVAHGQSQVPTSAKHADQPDRMSAQQNNPSQNPNRMDPSSDRNTAERYTGRASEVIGLKVRTTGDEEKGKIKDLMIGHDGRIVYAAVSFGGFLGVGDKLYAVPWDAIHIVKNGGKNEFAHIDVTEETIKSRKGFDQERWPDQADQTFLTTGEQRHAELPGAKVPTVK